MTSSHHLIAASRVEKTPVFNTSGERLGVIDDILIDKESGQSAYVLMSFSGFLGLGERYYPLPWSTMRFDVDLDGYVVALTRREIQDGVFVDDKEVADEVQWREALHAFFSSEPFGPGA
jgi:hypothetical protein